MEEDVVLSRIWVSTGRVAVGDEVELRADDKSLEDSAVVKDAVLSVVAEAPGSNDVTASDAVELRSEDETSSSAELVAEAGPVADAVSRELLASSEVVNETDAVSVAEAEISVVLSPDELVTEAPSLDVKLAGKAVSESVALAESVSLADTDAVESNDVRASLNALVNDDRESSVVLA